MGGEVRRHPKKAPTALADWGLIADLAESTAPGDQDYYAAYAPIMYQLDHAITVARRTRAVNTAFGTALTPAQVAADYPDETIDLLIAWQEHTDKAS